MTCVIVNIILCTGIYFTSYSHGNSQNMTCAIVNYMLYIYFSVSYL